MRVEVRLLEISGAFTKTGDAHIARPPLTIENAMDLRKKGKEIIVRDDGDNMEGHHPPKTRWTRLLDAYGYVSSHTAAGYRMPFSQPIPIYKNTSIDRHASLGLV